jgi:hypothetical protein
MKKIYYFILYYLSPHWGKVFAAAGNIAQIAAPIFAVAWFLTSNVRFRLIRHR